MNECECVSVSDEWNQIASEEEKRIFSVAPISGNRLNQNSCSTKHMCEWFAPKILNLW